MFVIVSPYCNRLSNVITNCEPIFYETFIKSTIVISKLFYLRSFYTEDYRTVNFDDKFTRSVLNFSLRSYLKILSLAL